ncbi:hypothetical protein Pcinc_009932 [Petrolisthes cinctipes]|uniref:Integrin alpha FG-GAP repeat containing 2 n=1 Tax=Petrolisthes cinctipes TaxID=88211 RepID=A0AAE1G4B4_PETCI|nr:hypothetical protein Pcinc_009932 [Petrolisthes cinctipes]
MKVASFVNYLEFEFEGTVNKNAVVLGDVDNDGLNELIIGNENGLLAVFKDENPRPVCVATDLGMISAIAVGDVFNLGSNSLIVVTGCGQCYLYDFEGEMLGRFEGEAPGGRSPEKQTKRILTPTHTQRIPSNAKMVLVGDVNGDSVAEVVVCLTDRVVRTYRWVPTGAQLGGRPRGKLVGLNKWELGDQIGGITFNKCRDGSPSLLVAQPGGTYFKVQPAGEDSQLDPFDERSSERLTKMSLDYEPLASARLRNPNIHTEICGNIRLSKVRPGSTSSETDASEAHRSHPVRLSSNETDEYCQYQSPPACSTTQTTLPGDNNNTRTSAILPQSNNNNYIQSSAPPPQGQANSDNVRATTTLPQENMKKRPTTTPPRNNSDIQSNVNMGTRIQKREEDDERKKSESKTETRKSATKTGTKEPGSKSETKEGENKTETRVDEKVTETREDKGQKQYQLQQDNTTTLHHGYALATLDGTLMLVQEGRIQWNLQVDHQLFAVCALDVTGDGRDEVVACAWDGNTYIVCEGTDCVRFTFHQPVSAFTAGHYGIKERQVTCLVYVSFGTRVWVYHDLSVAPVVTRTLTDILQQYPRYHALLQRLPHSLHQSHPIALRHLHHYLLYGPFQ